MCTRYCWLKRAVFASGDDDDVKAKTYRCIILCVRVSHQYTKRGMYDLVGRRIEGFRLVAHSITHALDAHKICNWGGGILTGGQVRV